MLIASRTGTGPPEILHYPDMLEEERRRLHGSGSHSAISRLTVAEKTVVEFAFTIGATPVCNGGRLLVVWRWPFDWGDLQTASTDEPGFVRWEGETREPIELAIRYQWIAGIEPWHHQLEARVVSGQLHEGDCVRLVCGASSTGGGSWSAPTCAARRVQFLMLIDHHGNHRRSRLVDNPSFPVIAGPPEGCAVIAPSDALVGQPFRVVVRADDCWGNATEFGSPVTLTATADAAVRPVEAPEGANACHFDVTAKSPGRLRLRLDNAATGLATESNEVLVRDEPPDFQLYWGDLHSGQTEIGCGAGSLAEHYAFARDCAGLQFITHQANDHYVTLDEWATTRTVTDAFDEPGRYVALLGCEWSPLTMAGGDRNVFYRRDEPRLRRSGRFFEEDQPDPEPDVPTAPEFHEAFRDQEVLVNIHVGGRSTNLEWYEPGIERLCEVHSTHGTSEWFVMDALRRGCVVGVTAGTDGVMGRPGACRPGRRLIRNVRNGTTAVYATELSREGIWEALKQRRCYATTGPRMRLWFTVNGQPMGACIERTDEIEIEFDVQAGAPLERIELLRGDQLADTWQIANPCSPGTDGSQRLRVLWGGTERRGTARLQRVNWDGHLTAAGGGLQLVETLPLQSCDDHVRQRDPSTIEWSSKTAGDHAGFVASSNGQGELQFHSQPVAFAVAPHDILASTVTKLAGGVGRYVSIGPAPRDDGDCDFAAGLTVESPDVRAGRQAYWLRVTRVDQVRAWTSPVYVG